MVGKWWGSAGNPVPNQVSSGAEAMGDWKGTASMHEVWHSDLISSCSDKPGAEATARIATV